MRKYTIFFQYTKIHIQKNLVKYTYIHDIRNVCLEYISNLKVKIILLIGMEAKLSFKLPYRAPIIINKFNVCVLTRWP